MSVWWSVVWLVAFVLVLLVPVRGEEVVQVSGSALECESEILRLRDRLERLERIFNISHLNPDLDGDLSALETFAQDAQSKLLKAIPPTDPECSFNWLVGKCYPLCDCHLAPKLGDYSPNRACRLIPPEGRDEDCDPNSLQTPWFVHFFAALSTLVRVGKQSAAALTRTITENAPPSDAACSWSWRLGASFGCSPKTDCAFIAEWGDYNLDRMCRLRVDDYDDADLDEESADEREREGEDKGEGEGKDVDVDGGGRERTEAPDDAAESEQEPPVANRPIELNL